MGLTKDFMDKFREQDDKHLRYPDVLHINNWEKASVRERLAGLQQLENAYAREQGRSPFPVNLQKYDSIEYIGYFHFDNKRIDINHDFLQNKQLHKSISKETALYMTVETLIHEGRHAYQEIAVRNPHVHSNQEEVQKWKENAVVYYGVNDLAKYRFQPMEKDAHLYAAKEVDKLYTRLEEQFGENRGYEDYRKTRNRSDELFTDIAQSRLGSNFEQRINDLLRRDYQSIIGRDDLNKAKAVNLTEKYSEPKKDIGWTIEQHQSYVLQNARIIKQMIDRGEKPENIQTMAQLNKKAEARLSADDCRIYDRIQTIQNEPPVKLHGANQHSRNLYTAYAQEDMKQNGGLWTKQSDLRIANSMMASGVRPQAIKAALHHSPGMVNAAPAEKSNKIKEIMTEIRSVKLQQNLDQPHKKKSLVLK